MPSADAVSDSTSDCSEWWLYWTTRGVDVPVGFDDMLDGWVNIGARERALGIEEATPILIDPTGRIDPRLAKFFRRSRFAFLAEGTRQSYVKDYRLFFTFLWRRGKYWDQADYDDIDDYEAWRRGSADNPRPIGGAKWARELAAFRLLFDWAVVSGAVERSPVATHTVRRRDGTVVEVAANRPKDVRVANVKWVTPRTYRLWRDIGLRGYSSDGLSEPGWRGRNDGRNAAFADLLFDTGLRLREGGCLLTVEVPIPMIGQVYCEGSVAAAIAKRRERSFYVPASTLSAIAGYIATTRRQAIGSAQRAGRYEQLAGKLIVTTATAKQRRLAWEDGLGRRGEFPVTAIDERQRRRLFVRGDEGLEPLQLWLTEGGLPMDYRSWDAVFAAASARCLRWGKPISITPHSCRHSFALKMLITLQRGLDSRYGLDKDDRDHLRGVYGNAFTLVKDLLGHRSEQTTRDIYLEPLSGLRLGMILDGSDDLSAILARVAAATERVVDIGPDEGGVP